MSKSEVINYIAWRVKYDSIPIPDDESIELESWCLGYQSCINWMKQILEDLVKS